MTVAGPPLTITPPADHRPPDHPNEPVARSFLRRCRQPFAATKPGRRTGVGATAGDQTLRSPVGRHLRRAALATGLSLALLAGCADPAADPSAPAQDTAVIGLTFVPNIQFAPFYSAQTAGLLPPGVTLRHHGAAEGLFTALALGQEQFVVAGGDEILQARADGADLVAVAAYYRRYPVRIIVPADSPVQGLADLKGRVIGLPGRFGESWFALLLALRQAGLSLDDVTIQEIGYTQQVALTTGKVDATVGFSNGDAVSFEQAGFPVRQLDPQTPLVSVCLATTQSQIDHDPATVRAVVAALAAGLELVVADPDQALEDAAAHIPDFQATADNSRAVLMATIPLFTDSAGKVDPTLDPAAWEAMAQAMAAAGLIPATLEAAAAIDTSFA
jgi:NitT/TauT family transport system substrate-binding protein